MYALRSLNNPQIPLIADIIKDPNDYFCIILNKSQLNLEDLIIENGKITENEILKIISMICLPLNNIHEDSIELRDLKLKNIRLDSIGSYEIY